MTDTSVFDRRTVLGSAAASSLAWGSAQAATKLNLEDPVERLKIRVKVTGSLKPEPGYKFYRLHLYAYMNEGNLIPLATMNNLAIATYTKVSDTEYRTEGYEVGVYCKFDTDEVLDVWENPITGEKREVWEFVGGPLRGVITTGGYDSGTGATVKPKEMRMEEFGGMVFVPSQSAFNFPNRVTPDKWPKESAGKTFYWDSHFVTAAKVEDVLNPALDSAPAFCQFQNFVSWHPWWGLGGKPGRTYGKAYGTKLKSLDELPPGTRAQFEKKTPEIFNLSNWKAFRDDFDDYMKARKPT